MRIVGWVLLKFHRLNLPKTKVVVPQISSDWAKSATKLHREVTLPESLNWIINNNCKHILSYCIHKYTYIYIIIYIHIYSKYINNTNTQESTKIVNKYQPPPEPGRFPTWKSQPFSIRISNVDDLRTQWRNANLKARHRFDANGRCAERGLEYLPDDSS